jgi:hypothetical protein
VVTNNGLEERTTTDVELAIIGIFVILFLFFVIVLTCLSNNRELSNKEEDWMRDHGYEDV